MKHANSKSLRGLTVLVAIFVLSMMLMPTAFMQRTHTFNFATNQAKQDFTLHNETGLDITELYLSPSAKDDWGADVLGKALLAAHDETDIVFSPRDKVDVWDMKVVFKTGRTGTWENLNLSRITDITISFNPENGKPHAEWKNGGE